MERHEYEDNPAARYQASQIKVCAKVNQVKEPHEPPVDKKIMMVTVPYTRNQNSDFKDCLRMRVDTCADINIMPLSVYQTIFDNPKKEKLMPTGIQVTTYNDSTLDLLGRCTLYLQQDTWENRSHILHDPGGRQRITFMQHITQARGYPSPRASTSPSVYANIHELLG